MVRSALYSPNPVWPGFLDLSPTGTLTFLSTATGAPSTMVVCSILGYTVSEMGARLITETAGSAKCSVTHATSTRSSAEYAVSDHGVQC
jgi:hypothetical protein